MKIRRLQVGEASLYREARLKSLKESPAAFSSTYESALQRSNKSWQAQADSTAIGSDRATFLILDDDQPLGLAALYRDDTALSTGELLQVWISPELRGKHVAVHLMDAVFKWAEQNRFENIKAEVLNTNHRALRFYQKYGFNMCASNAELNELIALTKLVQPAA